MTFTQERGEVTAAFTGGRFSLAQRGKARLACHGGRDDGLVYNDDGSDGSNNSDEDEDDDDDDGDGDGPSSKTSRYHSDLPSHQTLRKIIHTGHNRAKEDCLYSFLAGL